MKASPYGYSGAAVLALILGLGVWSPQSVVGQQKPQIPRFVVDPSWPQPGPRHWVTDRLVTQEMGATCADAKGNVVSLNRGNMQPIEKGFMLKAAPPVIEYDSAGNVVRAWGDRRVLPDGLHGCLLIMKTTSGLEAPQTASSRNGLAMAAKCSCRSGQRGSAMAPMGSAGAPGSTPAAPF